MSSDPKIVVDIEGRIDNLEAALGQMESKMDEAASGVEQGAKRVEGQLDKMGATLANRLVGVTAIITGLNSATRAVAGGLEEMAVEGKHFEDVAGAMWTNFIRGVPIIGSTVESLTQISRMMSGIAEEERRIERLTQSIADSAQTRHTVAELQLRLELARTTEVEKQLAIEERMRALQRATTDDGSADLRQQAGDLTREIAELEMRIGSASSMMGDAQLQPHRERLAQLQAERDALLRGLDDRREIQRTMEQIEQEGAQRRLEAAEQAERDKADRVAAVIEQNEQRIAALQSQAFQQEARIEGRDLDARLEALRHHYRTRWEVAEEGLAKELEARLYHLEQTRIISEEQQRIEEAAAQQAQRIADLETDIKIAAARAAGDIAEAEEIRINAMYDRLVARATEAERRLLEVRRRQELERIGADGSADAVAGVRMGQMTESVQTVAGSFRFAQARQAMDNRDQMKAVEATVKSEQHLAKSEKHLAKIASGQGGFF